MGLLTMWREARGRVLRSEYEDAIARMRNATPEARRAFLNNLHQCHENFAVAYEALGPRERKRARKEATHHVRAMWRQGDWPSALGLGVAMMNLESRYVPGADALYVRTESELLLKEAREAAERFSVTVDKWLEEGTPA